MNPNFGGKRKRGDIPRNDYSSEEEAEEERDVIQDEDDNPISEESGEDLMENAERDYQQLGELDRYENEGLDDEEYSDDMEARIAAERELNQKTLQEQAYQRRLPTAVMEEGLLESEDEDIRREARKRERQRFLEAGMEEEEIGDEPEDERFLDIEDAKGKLHIWIKEERTVRWIRRKFRAFLQSFRDDKNFLVYQAALREMCEHNRQSIEVAYTHLANSLPTLALWIAESPSNIFPYLNAIAYDLACSLYPNFENIQVETFVKIRDLPIMESLRDLRQSNLNTLIKIRGVVTRRSAVHSQMKKIYYTCNRCGDRKGPLYQNNAQEFKFGACAVCQSRGPFSVDKSQTVYRNHQKIKVQESPGSVPAGRVPRQKEVILLGDTIDSARPGDEIEVTGIYTNRYEYSLNVKHGFPVFTTIIEANNLKRISDIETENLSDDEKREIRQLAKKPDIFKMIVNSIAPSIYGHLHVKTAIALSMFGGVGKDVQGSHRIRGDINVLIVGDPGVAKSQFLKYVDKVFPRSVYTTGKGASAVGLTASVHKDYATNEWMLEGGALVLADKGICLIDEFDKMNDGDRTSIHEAMEQQSISISKAGIVGTLQARCAVIAAANPLKGRYNSQLSFADNVNLSDPILSRFDVLCVVKDEVNPDHDLSLASFVINSHIKNHPFYSKFSDFREQIQEAILPERNQVQNILDQEILRKYINYARNHIHPKISDIDRDKIAQFYSQIRAESEKSGLNLFNPEE